VPPLHARLRAQLVRPGDLRARRHLGDQPLVLLDLTEEDREQPRPLLVNEHHAEALVLVEGLEQGAHEGAHAPVGSCRERQAQELAEGDAEVAMPGQHEGLASRLDVFDDPLDLGAGAGKSSSSG